MTQLLKDIFTVEVPSMAFGFDINNYGNSSELMFMVDIADITDDVELESLRRRAGDLRQTVQRVVLEAFREGLAIVLT